jgi:hypothetical protein
MSRSFARFFGHFFKSLKPNDEPLSSEMNYFVSLTLGAITIGGTLGHCAYAFGTAETKFIKINKKYKFNRNGFTEFMIIDDNGNHYNVNNSVWYWKWDSIEDWHKLETSKDISIKYYGWRVPLLGLFPNIIMTRQETLFDYMSRIKFKSIDCDYGEKKEIQLTKEEREEIAKPLNPYHELWRKTSKYD